ncbi:hypothetical protein DXG01_004663 [Tephrocybe rancida]|nr:hypothetical protein DXG01_004663 [Tephrocybe rancida]
MTLKLKPLSPRSPASSPSSPFSFTRLDDTPEPAELTTPPTVWLPGSTMKIFGHEPLNALPEVGGLVRCQGCGKVVLRSVAVSHGETCKKEMKKEGDSEGARGTTGGKKRKASPEGGDAAGDPPKKKVKALPKITKGRTKGPVDYNRQCGVINDKNLPCSRSLTCKSHSMGAKRAVQGRTRPYDELLLDWQRANNPNFVEPVKRETKAEKKEKREKEKEERRRLMEEEARQRGEDPAKLAGQGGTGKKASGVLAGTKKGKKAAAAAAAARLAGLEGAGEEGDEDPELLDSEAEMDELVRVVRTVQDKGVLAVPLAVPCDAGSWFVQRRERARCCRDLLIGALGSGGGLGLGMNMGIGMNGMNMSMGLGIGNRTNGIAVRH